ncbi:MAG: DsbA family oxidoreductase, partial [Halobacteriota archaeon]
MEGDRGEDAITVYSDYVCPFCYLGRLSLERYRRERERPLDVDWRPFDLRMQKRRDDGSVDWSVDDGKDEAYFDRVRESVRKLKDRYEADEMLSLDELPENVDSFPAQVASYHVQREHPDRWTEFDGALFDALWLDGHDVGEPDVLAQAAGSVGLDAQEVLDAVEDAGPRSEVRE